MASPTRQFGLALVCAALWLVCASGAPMLTRSVAASTEPLASDSSTVCFDIATDSANLTYVFVDSGCTASPSEVAITVDGVPVPALYTDDGPCESIPRDVWFPLQANQDGALVCVSVQGDCPAGIQVYVEAGSACIAGTMP